jgi:hypothetical protein
MKKLQKYIVYSFTVVFVLSLNSCASFIYRTASTSPVPADQPIAVTAANDPASLRIADLLRSRLMDAGFQVQSLYDPGALPSGVQNEAFSVLADVADGISETGRIEMSEFLAATEATAGRSYVEGYADYLQAVRRVTDAERIVAVSALGSSRRVSAVAVNTVTHEVELIYYVEANWVGFKALYREVPNSDSVKISWQNRCIVPAWCSQEYRYLRVVDDIVTKLVSE